MSEKDINRWQALIAKRPEGPLEMSGPHGSSYDRTVNAPISDDMLAELAEWLKMGYTPWNGRSMPLSPGDRQFMYLLYYSVQGLIARVRPAEKAAQVDDVAKLQIGVEKMLCDILGRPWAPSGFSIATLCAEIKARLEQPQATPSSNWKVRGEADPHVGKYDGERSTLMLGKLTDDELANAVFTYYDIRPPLEDILSGKANSPIAYVTAAKERIRWLSRKLEAAQAERCLNCDDTGDVHSIDGEWRGRCHCAAGRAPINPVPNPVADDGKAG